MRLDQILKIENINESLKAKTKAEVLSELSSMITRGYPRLTQAGVFNVLQQREKLGSTGIGDGIAIPHGKVSNLEEVVVSFGRSREGVDFEALDGKPVHIFFLLLAPEDCAGQHLKALARISKMLKMGNFRRKLMEAKDRTDLYKIIMEQDEVCVT